MLLSAVTVIFIVIQNISKLNNFQIFKIQKKYKYIKLLIVIFKKMLEHFLQCTNIRNKHFKAIRTLDNLTTFLNFLKLLRFVIEFICK